VGITIHWELASERKTKKAVCAQLEKVRQICLDLGFAEVGEVRHVPAKVCKAGTDARGLDENLRWAMIQAQKYVRRGRYTRAVMPVEFFWLPLWAGEGCEPTNLMLGRYPKEKGWSGEGFTKTQYAEHFVQAHLLVIAALDACKKVSILKEVTDEAEFWETRDLKVLAKNINESTAFIAQVSELLKGQLGSTIESPIDACRNYMTVEPEETR